MKFMPKKKIIYGCDSRGDGESPYLTRWSLGLGPLGTLYLHCFHRSDADEMHDHPWPFVSLILWRGYVEETDGWIADFTVGPRTRKRVWPGMILRRKATHVHRVELVDGKEAWTLVWRGKECREWGFWTPAGWQRWKDYFSDKGC